MPKFATILEMVEFLDVELASAGITADARIEDGYTWLIISGCVSMYEKVRERAQQIANLLCCRVYLNGAHPHHLEFAVDLDFKQRPPGAYKESDIADYGDLFEPQTTIEYAIITAQGPLVHKTVPQDYAYSVRSDRVLDHSPMLFMAVWVNGELARTLDAKDLEPLGSVCVPINDREEICFTFELGASTPYRYLTFKHILLGDPSEGEANA